MDEEDDEAERQIIEIEKIEEEVERIVLLYVDVMLLLVVVDEEGDTSIVSDELDDED